MIAANEVPDPHPGLVVATALLLAGAALILLVLWLRRRPSRVRPGPPSEEFGPETPALVDLLTGGFIVEDDAVPATVVDLAARRWITIEDVTGGHVAVRVRARDGRGELTAYEERVLRHIGSRTVNGVTPAAALTLGPEGVSTRWWKGFVREVQAHGRDLGLNQPRWRLTDRAMVWFPVILAWVPALVAVDTADRTNETGAWGRPALLLLGVCVPGLLGLSAVAGRITTSEAQTDTEEGRRAAARWLGVREHLSSSTSFEDKTAPSVVLWERSLAYATAMGLAPVVQAQLPFETDHDRHAWSRAAGYWRRVRIGYRTLRPGWGQAPWWVLLRGLAVGVGAAFGFVLGIRLAREDVDLGTLSEPWVDRVPILGLGLAVVAVLVLAWQLVLVAVGLMDLFTRRTIQGEVVRRRLKRTGDWLPRPVRSLVFSGQSGSDDREERRYVAVDDGTRDRFLAFRVRPEIYRQVREGAVVELRHTPRTGYVTDVVEVQAPPRSESAVPHEAVTQLADGLGSAIDGYADRLAAAMNTAMTRTDADGHTLLDRTDSDGRPLRDSLQAAQHQLDQARAATPDAAGGDMLGGLLDQVGEALAAATAADESEPQQEPEDQSR